MFYKNSDIVKMVSRHTNLPKDLVAEVIKAYGAEISRLAYMANPSMSVRLPYLGIVQVWQRPEGETVMLGQHGVRKRMRLIPDKNIVRSFTDSYQVTPDKLDPLGDLQEVDDSEHPTAQQ